MPDETKPTVAPEKPQIKGVDKQKRIRIASIKEPPIPQESATGTKFALTVVTMGFKQEDVPCTQQVYAWVKETRPSFKVHSDWVLTVDKTSGLVVHVTETAKPTSMPGFKVSDETREPAKNVVVSLYPGGASAITGIPDRVSDQVLDEIHAAVADYDEVIHVGSKVGRFSVVKVSEVPGATEVHVDQNPRQ